jgi:predicted DNA-binding transcriptional regulator AlpA
MPRGSKQRNAASPSDIRSERWKVSPAQNMLSPQTAWRALCRRTGGGISRATFYRWVNSGKLYSVRLGFLIFIPQIALEDLVKQCLDGERF